MWGFRVDRSRCSGRPDGRHRENNRERHQTKQYCRARPGEHQAERRERAHDNHEEARKLHLDQEDGRGRDRQKGSRTLDSPW